MTLVTAPGSHPFDDYGLLKLSRCADVMAGPRLQGTSFIVFFKFLVQYNKSFQSSYSASFSEPCTSSTCTNFLYCGHLEGAFEATYWRYFCATTLMRLYMEALQLVKKVSADVAADDSTAGKCPLGIAHLKSVLLSESE